MTVYWPFGLLCENAYRVILADPPWQFRGYASDGVPQRASQQHYPTMSREELKALPVDRLAAPTCALLMWGISSHLPQALELGAHWGFEFKSKAFCWAKLHPRYGEASKVPISYSSPANELHWHQGLGKGTRRNTEDVWLFTRGAPRRLNADVPELLVAPRGKHSVKPMAIHHRIERLYPGPYVELFARRPAPGWSVWGNEV